MNTNTEKRGYGEERNLKRTVWHLGQLLESGNQWKMYTHGFCN
jgi:hypothetical protein